MNKEILDYKVIEANLLMNIKSFMDKAHKDKVVIGMSGGKDSTVAAALCCKALGPENVLGVILPDGIGDGFEYYKEEVLAELESFNEEMGTDYTLEEFLEYNENNPNNTSDVYTLSYYNKYYYEYTSKIIDIQDAREICSTLGIHYDIIDISNICSNFDANIMDLFDPSNDNIEEAKINVRPRVRMTMLRALSQAQGALLCGTGNASENYVGYFTKDGDQSCDFNPLGNLTSIEVVELGLSMGLDPEWVKKTPSDGISGKSDEDKLGVSYQHIHEFIKYNMDAFYEALDGDDYDYSKAPLNIMNDKLTQEQKDAYTKIYKLHKAAKHKYKDFDNVISIKSPKFIKV